MSMAVPEGSPAKRNLQPLDNWSTIERNETENTTTGSIVLLECEVVRLAFDDPWERLCDAVDDEDLYEVDAEVRKCVDTLAELQDACRNLSSQCNRRRSTTRADIRLLHRELTTLIRGLKFLSSAGVDGEELQCCMDEWYDSFRDWDTSFTEIVEALREDSDQ